MSPEERWPALLLQLRTDDWERAVDLAQALGVSERTVYRDVHALVETGVPVQGVPGKGYRLPEDYFVSPVTLTSDEAVMLVLGSAYAAQNFGGRYHASARSAQQKIQNRLSREERERALTLQGSVHLVPPSAFGNPTEEALLQQVRQALLEERTLRILRSSRAAPREDARTGRSGRDGGANNLDAPQDAPGGEAAAAAGEAAGDEATESPPSALRTDPYGLVRQDDTWYLVGYFHGAARVRHIRLDTVRRIEPTDDHFERPAGYRAEREQAPRPDRTIRVVFAAEVAPSVQVGPSLHVEDRNRLSDGRLVLTLAVYHEQEVMPWLLSWGTHVRVLEPVALRRRLADEASRIAAQYQDPPSLLDAGTSSFEAPDETGL